MIVGTYQVTVTDVNGCTKTVSTSLTQPSDIQYNRENRSNLCDLNNGILIINVTGGVDPYSYLWNNGATTDTLNDLSPGIYTCTITDYNECTKTLKDTVKTINPLRIVGLNSESETCNMQDGSIELTIENGTPIYEYQWISGNSEGTSLNMLSSSFYTITVTDQSGCIDTVSVLVDRSFFTSSILNTTPSVCERNDGSVTIEVNGGSGNHNIDWGNITDHTENYAYNLSQGNYRIYVKDSLCRDTLEFSIDEIPKPIACIENEMSDGILIHQPISLQNCSMFSTHYQWIFGDGSSQLTQHPTHFYNNSGLYPVQLFAYNDYDCIDSTLTHIIVNDVAVVYIPNSFTPNNDLINPIFLPICSFVSDKGYSLKSSTDGEVLFLVVMIYKLDGTV